MIRDTVYLLVVFAYNLYYVKLYILFISYIPDNISVLMVRISLKFKIIFFILKTADSQDGSLDHEKILRFQNLGILRNSQILLNVF